MRIGELSQRTSLSRDTIRFYERKGLISSRPSTSKSNTYRDYGNDTVLTLEIIKEAQAAGFTLTELNTFLEQIDYTGPRTFDGEAFLQRKITEVEETIHRAERFLKTLKDAQKALAAAATDPSC